MNWSSLRRFGMPSRYLIVSLIISCGSLAIGQRAASGAEHTRTTSNSPPFIQVPASKWIEDNKKLYQAVLQQDRFDVLVVPFQVDGHGIDMIGRSLMTRYLVSHIEQSTGMKVPDPTLVELALGEKARTINDSEVYELGSKLRVRVLVRGYVGHDNNGNITFKLKVQRDLPGIVHARTPTTERSFGSVPLLAENPPSEQLLALLPKIMTALQIDSIKKFDVSRYNSFNQAHLPLTLGEVPGTTEQSPIAMAYKLQLLGMLLPGDDVRQREMLFERSLTALLGVSPESPDYGILKARAYFYLYRRPAALRALGKSDSAAARALRASMNGNLAELTRETAKIPDRYQRLFSEIELTDLRYDYGVSVAEHVPSVVASVPEAWRPTLVRRLQNGDQWQSWSNFSVVQELNKAFPISGMKTETVFDRYRLEGRTPTDADLTAAILEHVRRIISDPKQREGWAQKSWALSRLDYLRFLSATSESNMIRSIWRPLWLQNLPRVAYELANSYALSYEGHPQLTALRGLASLGLAETVSGNEKEILLAKAQEDCRNSFIWQGGQVSIRCRSGTITVPRRISYPTDLYLTDFPKRSEWMEFAVMLPREARKEWLREVFDNTHTSIGIVREYSAHLTGEDANRLVSELENRFIGHPLRQDFLADIAKKQGGQTAGIEVFRKAVAANTTDWEPYHQVGKDLVSKGKFKEASDVFLRYPGFSRTSSVGSVGLSNYSYIAGSYLYWQGAYVEARPLYKLSAEYDTGSAASLTSAIRIALLDRDYAKATNVSLQRATRYQSTYAYRDYMSLLHLQGEHETAWRVFAAVLGKHESPHIWDAADVGHRMAQQSDQQIRSWVNQPHIRTAKFEEISLSARYAFMALNIDRHPNQAAVNAVLDLATGDSSQTQQLKAFARGYHFLRLKQYPQAFDALRGPMLLKKQLHPWYEQALLPYIIWSAKEPELQTALNEQMSLYVQQLEKMASFSSSDDVSYGYLLLMAKAAKAARHGNHEEAVRNIALAFNNVPHTETSPINYWYQITEFCEWFYEDSRDQRYIDMALNGAARYQVIAPMYAWAYAFEAKYAKDPERRRRALAIALHLDPRSVRLSLIPEQDKARARDWFVANNPFQPRDRKKVLAPAGRDEIRRVGS